MEVFESIFHFERKFFNTLKVVFTRPGRITRDFWEGKRARYRHPFRLYVFVSFLFFLIANKVAAKTAGQVGESLKKTEKEQLKLNDLISTGTKTNGRETLKGAGLQDFGEIKLEIPVDSLTRRQFVSQLKQANDARLDSLLDEELLGKSADNRAKLRKVLALVPATTSLSSQLEIGPIKVGFNSLEERHVFARKVKLFSDAQIDSLLTTQKVEPSRLNRTLLRQFAKFDLADKHFFHDVTHAFIKNLSLVMFVLMPFVALLLLLFFYSRKHYYFEHLIFPFTLTPSFLSCLPLRSPSTTSRALTCRRIMRF